MPFTGRGRADDHSNYSKCSAAAVQCSGGLSRMPQPPPTSPFHPSAMDATRDRASRVCVAPPF
jgi:hypothetical protein